MITEKIAEQIKEAMKAREEIRLSTLRMLSSALSYEKIALQHELTEEEELSVVRKEAKKRKDAIEIFKKANEIERADKEAKELLVLEEYLPAQMSDSELEGIVDGTIHEMGVTSMSDMGRVIGAVVKKTGGRADGGQVSSIVRLKLQGK